MLGCATSHYVRPDEVTEWDETYTDTDLKLLAEKMVLSISQADLPDRGEKPRLAFLRISNSTSQHIDTDGLADKIKVQLVKLGRFLVLSRDVLQEQAEEIALVDRQRIDVAGAVKLGNVLGADYFLTGDLMSIEKESASKALAYYKLTMELVDVQTSAIVWMEEKEIKKAANKSWYE
jgi:uncharacterized protein (TIGR02722 family)